MKLLLHICCGPCSIMPIIRLREAGHELTGYFYNPNIHPLAEYLRRREGAAAVAEKLELPMLWATNENDYDTLAWTAEAVRRMAPAGGRIQPDARCSYCWEERLLKTARTAWALGFDGFCTSLLYSKWQKHEGIAAAGRRVEQLVRGERHDAPVVNHAPVFYYADFRPDWQGGVQRSREWGIYRQQYCGCVYSENERYSKDLARSNAALAAQA